MLKNHSFKTIYDSSNDDIAKDFIEPALKNSQIYKRGVGYFTSGWLSYNAHGLASFVSNGGFIQFITSPILDENDIKALQGEFDKTAIIDKVILKNIELLEKKLKEETLNLLGWLVYDEILEFKFAIPQNHLANGEFHDKFGIFIDEENNFIAFNGSMNDSIKGNFNYESISVFKSWGDETSKLNAKLLYKRFDDLWNNRDYNVSVLPISEVVRKKLIKLKKYSNRPYNIKSHTIKSPSILYGNQPFIPSYLELREYQKNAINSWILNNGKGILSMATGSGKTITALSAITHLIKELQKNDTYIPLLVVVPYIHLIEQWSEEAEKFGIKFIKCSSDYYKWEKKLNEAITNFSFDKTYFIAIITTIGTYKSDRFQRYITQLNNLLLVVDEVHNFGAPEIKKKYLENARFRLGLSATPARYMDDEGSTAIFKYFDNIVYSYGLKEAIENKNLTPYYYYPIFVSLTDDEEYFYKELTEKIFNMIKMGHDIDEPDSALKALLLKRAKIIATAQNKLNALKSLLKEKELIQTKRNLFYVAAHIEKNNEKEIKMIDKVMLLLSELGMQVDKFTSEESKDERKYLIEKLTEGYIDGLVAIRCLDEGVDIPSVERAFILSSSSNPKEFVQRRGRVLRQSRATGKKYAYIYDFIVLPDLKKQSYYSVSANFERKYIEKELTRFQEFAELALNAHEVEPKILEIKKYYRLLHI
jgi:DNA phosphorothioation system restriction enzyme